MIEKLDFGFLRRQPPLILQTEAAECGLASLAMVASYHGFEIDLPSLRRRFAVSLKGMTLTAIMEVAGRLKLMSRPVRLDLLELSDLRLPCILHWDLNHFVVLEAVTRKSVSILDPAFGRRQLPLAEVSKHFTGVALELIPTSEFKKAEEKQRISLSALLGNVQGLWQSLSAVLALSFALQVFVILGPILNQLVVDHALVTADRDLIATLAIGFLFLLFAQSAIGLFRSWVVMVFASKLSLQWSSNVLTHLLRLPVAFFERRHVGDLVSRFGAVASIQRTLTTTFVEAILDGVMAAVTLSMMLLYSATLTTITIGAVVVYATLRWVSFRPFRNASEEQIVLAAKQQSHFLETLRGVSSIKLFAKEDDRRARWQGLTVDTTNRALKTQRMSLAFSASSTVIFGTQSIAIVWLGADLVLQNLFSIGMLFAFISYKDQFSARVSGLIDKWFELRMLRLHAERLADIVLAEPEPDIGEAGLDRPLPDTAIEIVGVKYRYADSEPYVLSGVTFRVTPGESVALVGPSGCGKTTLMKLLLGVLPLAEGEIRLGGTPIEKLGLRRVRALIGTVMQDDRLLAGSIAENISFFEPAPDTKRVEECAKLAAVHDEIISMPMGYETLVGELGSALSGGQRQRIMLARALYKKPQLLLLDEATSHLDLDRERLVNAAIKRLKVTRLIIAHRPETIASADRIVLLEKGIISHQGPVPFKTVVGAS